MGRISVVERAGRAVWLVLVVVIVLVLVGKVLVWTTDWLDGWSSSVDVALFLLLGALGVLNGLHAGRTVWGVMSVAGGAMLLLVFFAPDLSVLPLVLGVGVLLVLVGVLFGRSGGA